MTDVKICTGIDLVFVPRMKVFLENDAAVKRVFHNGEILPLTPEHCAGVFAAKEAFFKAIQMPPRWLDVEVQKQSDGKPVLYLSPLLAQKIESHDMSITHDGEYAAASVVLLLK